MGYVVSILAAVLLFTAESANAVKAADCGSNMTQVREIITRKFPQMGTDHTNQYLGTWVYPGYEPMTITDNEPFSAMGSGVLICPQENKSFLVYWRADRTFVGVLKRSGRNTVTVYQTSYGDIALDRSGSVSAGR